MFIKEVSPPKIIYLLEILLRRLPKSHPKRQIVEDNLSRRRAGYKGEQNLVFYLEQSPINQFLIFHNLVLTVENQSFQIDFLLLSNNYAIIMEVKNLAGELYFDKDFRQLIRNLNGKTECFPDPLAQVDRQRELLIKWLANYKLQPIPLEKLVVISNLPTIIRASPGYKEVYETVSKADQILHKVKSLEQKQTQSGIDQKGLEKIKRFLLSKQISDVKFITNQFDIDESDLISGVLCPNCEFQVMQYKSKSWQCNMCGYKDKKAYIEAIKEYFLLFQQQINNKELREFLGVPSSRTATYILSKMNLPHSGNNIGRTYFPPPL
ncbi:nuclease-related domain-containing protein [Neobacillus terrae]|uniref:nuclease-related domain-containing protein n=1 Tax=Neobacillus terrae TaxID=3034837 RepID=UPI00140AE031|nr:nuclease-related domain-containing protein [Neobacillus terrae]NHM33341.1 NERD domain-containing protein [Neobacillus terrae]